MPEELKAPCNGVVEIPDNTLESPSRTARLWGEDRASLGDCARRHGALVASVVAIEEQGEPSRLADETGDRTVR